MSTCPTLAPEGPFIGTMLSYIDCQAQAIGEGGYSALAATGSSTALVLTGVLTIFIAAFGYRMLLGDLPTPRLAIIGIAKIGIVLMLATSWGAYRPLVYDLTMAEPARLAADIGGPSGVPGAGGGLVAWLQAIDDGLVELGVVGAGQPRAPETAQPVTGPGGVQAVPVLPQLRFDPVRDQALIAEARMVYLTSAIAAFASVRLIAGLLLALGPLFAMTLLFGTTQGLFEGWVRALVGTIVGATATTLILGVELALLGPWLAAILAERHADLATPSVPVELFVVTLVFALTLLAALVAAAWVAWGFRLPEIVHRTTARLHRSTERQIATDQRSRPLAISTTGAPSRALALAGSIEAAQQREYGSRFATMTLADQARNPSVVAASSTVLPIIPLGRSHKRRVTSRVSASAGRRDRRI